VLICFAWVPIRFLMNPIHKLGASVDGGSGVSGAFPYFGYVLAAASILMLGAILNDRQKLLEYLKWSFYIALIDGVGFFICAFIPATGPFLNSLGVFNAGNIGDGIQRFVAMPGYGLFVVEVALCPGIIRASLWLRAFAILAGLAMMILGGNRSALAALFVAVPVILLLRKKLGALIIAAAISAVAVMAIHVSIANQTDVPPLLRSFGFLDSKIDEATGGTASAEWRYQMWSSALEKIMEEPLTGKGFGNLPDHLDPSLSRDSTDYEITLAGGEAHNGFVNAAYGFGIPFVVGLSLLILYRLLVTIRVVLTIDRHDPELRDFYAFIGCMLVTCISCGRVNQPRPRR
jgi:hypothetical protein